MSKKSPWINYKAMPNQNFVKNFEESSKFELVVTMRIKDVIPKPNCNENRNELIVRLKKQGINKIIDLKEIKNAKEFRERFGLL